MIYKEIQEDSLQRRVCWLPIERIRPRDSLFPAADAAQRGILALTEDIRQRGLQRPILVRQNGEGLYSVASGNRRLLACRRAGMTHVEAIILPESPLKQSVPQLLDMLAHRRLHYLEEAEVLELLNQRYGYTREELARILGEPPQCISDRMRLTKLEEEVRICLLEEELPERAALALLRLEDVQQRLHVVQKAARERLCIREVELLVSAASTRKRNEKEPPRSRGGKVISLVRDPRLYVNAIRSITEQMQSAGVAATMTEKREGGCMEVTVRLPVRRRRTDRYRQLDARQSM